MATPTPPLALAGSGSKVESVYSVDEDLTLNKRARMAYSVMKQDLLPDDEQGQLKWRGDPADTYSDWTIEVVFEAPVAAAPAPAPEPAISTTTMGTMGTMGAPLDLDDLDMHMNLNPLEPASPAANAPNPNQQQQQPASMISPEPVAGVAGQEVATPTATAPTPTVTQTQTVTQTYHVHRYFLGFGSRRSEYFAKLFKENGKPHTSNHTTTLQLEYWAAKAFPDLLDHLYDARSQLVIHTETATALHALGVQLEMTHLQHYAKHFCEKDLCLQNLETYYEHAKLFQDETIHTMVVEFIAANLAHISTKTFANFVTHQTDANLWKTALDRVTPTPHNFTIDLHISRLVSQFGLAHKDSLDADTFDQLTNQAKLRKVDPVVAWTLCELDDHFAAEATSSGTDEREHDLSSIQQRCATALAEDWMALDATQDQVKKRKRAFLVDLLDKSLSRAKKENEKLGGGKTSAVTTAPSAGGARRHQPRRR